MSTLTIRLPDDKYERLKALARSNSISMNELLYGLATGYKYRLAYVQRGECVLRYDNEPAMATTDTCGRRTALPLRVAGKTHPGLSS